MSRSSVVISGGVVSVAPPPLDLSFLSGEERQLILAVLQRDEQLRTQEQARIG